MLGHRVFVYGTLKQGCPNHRLLADAMAAGGARLVSATATARGAFRMVVASPFHIPFCLRWAGPADTAVDGEVYEVDDGTLARLDELEQCPHFYVRETVPVHLSGKEDGHEGPGGPGGAVEAGMYVLPDSRFDRGCVEALPAVGCYGPEHAREYVPPGERPADALRLVFASLGATPPAP